jgi:hypothetical protein
MPNGHIRQTARLLLADAVEKGFCGELRATLLQDQDQMRNLDSKINRLDSFVSFYDSTALCGAVPDLTEEEFRALLEDAGFGLSSDRDRAGVQHSRSSASLDAPHDQTP